jgi:predicted SnoaL-like aldol condensation-catalyzing enzyme
MKKYDTMLASLEYVNKGMTGLDVNITEQVIEYLRHNDSVDRFTAGLVKFFKTCYKKRLFFEAEIFCFADGNKDRIYYFKAGYEDIDNGTIQVFRCNENGCFDYHEDKQVLSLEKFLKCFKAFVLDLKKTADN